MSKLFRLLRVIPAGAKGTAKELRHEENCWFINRHPGACGNTLKPLLGGWRCSAADMYSIAVPREQPAATLAATGRD